MLKEIFKHIVDACDTLIEHNLTRFTPVTDPAINQQQIYQAGAGASMGATQSGLDRQLYEVQVWIKIYYDTPVQNSYANVLYLIKINKY